MKKPNILAVSASPSANSRSAQVAAYALSRLESPDASTQHLVLRDLPADKLLRAESDDPALARANRMVEEADGIIFATPIYKASYSGLLKVFLDQLGQFALAGKAILPLATGGSLAHVLALDYALRPVLQSMGARHIVQSQFIPEASLRVDGVSIKFNNEMEQSLNEAIYHFKCSMSVSNDPLLGHPRPVREAMSPAAPAGR